MGMATLLSYPVSTIPTPPLIVGDTLSVYNILGLTLVPVVVILAIVIYILLRRASTAETTKLL